MAKERTDDNPQTPDQVQDRIWELAEKIDIGMFTTWDGEKQHSRPLSARVRRGEHAIYFLVDEGGEKNAEIERFPAASCAWADNGNYKYALIAGKAKISNDRAKIAEIWSDFDEAWRENKNDPAIRLLTLTPQSGELWDSSGKIVSIAGCRHCDWFGAADGRQRKSVVIAAIVAQTGEAACPDQNRLWAKTPRPTSTI